MSEQDGQHGEEASASAETPLALSRRGMLGAATSGFALAASGLFLPQWLEKAAAREGAHDGKLGGRHGNNRRGRGKRPRRGQHKHDARHQDNKNGARGAFPHLRWIWFYVYNDLPVTTPNQSVSVQGWAKGLFDSRWQKVPLVSVANGTYQALDFRDNQVAAVVIDGRHYVEADNTYLPDVILRVYAGGTMTETGLQGGIPIISTSLPKEDESIEQRLGDRYYTIKRLYDNADYKLFDIHFRPWT